MKGRIKERKKERTGTKPKKGEVKRKKEREKEGEAKMKTELGRKIKSLSGITVT